MESRGGYRGPPSADRDGNFRKRRLDGSVDGVETRYNNGNRENGYERSGKIQKTRDSYAQAPQRSYVRFFLLLLEKFHPNTNQ